MRPELAFLLVGGQIQVLIVFHFLNFEWCSREVDSFELLRCTERKLYYSLHFVNRETETVVFSIVISDSERFVYQPTADTPIPTQIFLMVFSFTII